MLFGLLNMLLMHILALYEILYQLLNKILFELNILDFCFFFLIAIINGEWLLLE
jgi:hypothetical protein